MERPPEEQEIVRYFLGDVSDEDRDRIGEKTIVDSEYAEFAEGVAFDLMDSYARNQLSAEERRKFEQCFLVSDERREQVLTMSTLVIGSASARVESRAAKREPLAHQSWWPAWFVNAGFGLRLAGGIAVVVIVALQGWVISQWWPRRQAPVVAMGSLTPKISIPLARSGDEIQEWRVSRETAYAALNLAISEVGSTYRVELQQNGRALWREEGSRPASLDGTPVIVVQIPTSILVENVEYTVAWQSQSAPDEEPSSRRYRVKYAQ